MDRFEKRLKRDAKTIAADVSPELRSRIDASLRGTAPAPASPPPRKALTFRLWLAASLSGAAAAVLVIALVPRESLRPGSPEQPVARAVPRYAQPVDRAFPLKVETAELTAPLEQELEDLQADIEKARENVEEDLDRFTF